MVAVGTYPPQIGNKNSQSTESRQIMDRVGSIGSLVSSLFESCPSDLPVMANQLSYGGVSVVLATF